MTTEVVEEQDARAKRKAEIQAHWDAALAETAFEEGMTVLVDLTEVRAELAQVREEMKEVRDGLAKAKAKPTSKTE